MPKMRRPDGRTVSVSQQGVEALQSRGYTLLGPADTASSAQGATPAPAEPSSPEPPAKSASKADWVAYATAQGVEDADDFTKDELIDKVG